MKKEQNKNFLHVATAAGPQGSPSPRPSCIDHDMLTAVVEAGNDPAPLVRTLGSLVPAVAEGIIRDGFVMAATPDAELEAVADAAGCTLVTGKAREILHRALQDARGDYFLFLAAGSVLEPGWWIEAAGFVQNSRSGVGPGHAAFAWSSHGTGLRARLTEIARRGMVAITGRPHPGQAVILRRSILQESPAGAHAAFPPAANVRPVLLRARAYVGSQ
jgi:hypothetical protein